MKEWINDFHNKYRDPDSISINENNEYIHENEDFYKGYKELLEKRSDKFDILFCPPKEPGIIIVNIETEKKFWLKSDQFGFSAPSSTLNHPYDVYLLKVAETQNEQMIEKAKENVKNWISETRKAGGSFLWPMERDDDKFNLNPKYNMERGGTKYQNRGSYIEDRVDLTLFELYEIYKNKSEIENKLKDKGVINNNILSNNVLYKKCFTDTMKEWLFQFESFEEYVDFFGFGPFIDESTGAPYDLLSNPLVPLTEDTPRKRMLYGKEITIEQYETLFNRILDKTQKRRIELLKNNNV